MSVFRKTLIIVIYVSNGQRILEVISGEGIKIMKTITRFIFNFFSYIALCSVRFTYFPLQENLPVDYEANEWPVTRTDELYYRFHQSVVRVLSSPITH